MKKILILLILVCSAVFAMQAQTDSNNTEIAKHFLKLDSEKFATLSKNDTVINEISKSIKVKDTMRLRRRVDSLLSKNYTLDEFFVILKIDRVSRNRTIELDRRKIKNRIKIDSIQQIDAFIDETKRRLKEDVKSNVKTKN